MGCIIIRYHLSDKYNSLTVRMFTLCLFRLPPLRLTAYFSQEQRGA